MFLSRFSEKSQIAFLPLGLGGAFNVLAAPVLTGAAIPATPTASETADFQLLSVLLTDVLLTRTAIDGSDPLSRGVTSQGVTSPGVTSPGVTSQDVISLSFTKPEIASLSFSAAKNSYQPTFLTPSTQPKVFIEKASSTSQQATEALGLKTLETENSSRPESLTTTGAAAPTQADQTQDAVEAEETFGGNAIETFLKETASRVEPENDAIEEAGIKESSQLAFSPLALHQRLDGKHFNRKKAIALSKLLDAIDLHHHPSAAHLAATSHQDDVIKTSPEAAPFGPLITPSFSKTPHSTPPQKHAAPKQQKQPRLDSLLPRETQPTQAISEQAIPEKAITGLAIAQQPAAQQTIPEQPIATQQPIAEQQINQQLNNAQLTDRTPVLAQLDTQLEAQGETTREELFESLPERPPISPERLFQTEDATDTENETDDELGQLRLQLQRSRKDEDLGILRLLQTAKAPPPPPKQPIAFLAGRLGFFDTNNAFRFKEPIDNQIYQAGLSLFLFPELTETTSLYAIAETNIARYNDIMGLNPSPNYNEAEFQLGLRQKLFPRTYAQIGWRNQMLFTEGYRERKFTANYIDAQLSHRAVLNSRTWVDGFYQLRRSFTRSEREGVEEAARSNADRLRQTFTLSFNYRVNRDLRTSLLYQLDFADFTRTDRFDTYQQVLGIVSYNITPESRISLFGGTRFGRSSRSSINLDDTFYGAGLNVTVPLF